MQCLEAFAGFKFADDSHIACRNLGKAKAEFKKEGFTCPWVDLCRKVDQGCDLLQTARAGQPVHPGILLQAQLQSSPPICFLLQTEVGPESFPHVYATSQEHLRGKWIN